MPKATSRSEDFSLWISVGVTMGGRVLSFAIDWSAAFLSSYSTSCLIGFDRQACNYQHGHMSGVECRTSYTREPIRWLRGRSLSH